MPPRFAYWTILVDNQPTAFRAADEEDLIPTLNRLKQKHPSAVMKWFQHGQLWTSRLEAHDAMVAGRRDAAAKARRAREAKAGAPPRDRKWRPGGAHRDPRQKYKDAKKAKWTRYKQHVRTAITDRRKRKEDEPS
jgi:hypothetical protein